MAFDGDLHHFPSFDYSPRRAFLSAVGSSGARFDARCYSVLELRLSESNLAIFPGGRDTDRATGMSTVQGPAPGPGLGFLAVACRS